MDKVDEMVIQAVEERVFAPDRIAAILGAVTERPDETRHQLEAEIDRQRIAVTEAQSRLDRLYDAVEAGVAELHGSRFKDRIHLAKLQIREGGTNRDSSSAQKRKGRAFTGHGAALLVWSPSPAPRR